MGTREARRQVVWAVATVLTAIAVTLGVADAPAATKTAKTSYTHGFDVSWPQCSGSAAHHMPPRLAAFVILGLTDGAGHTLNPCLGSQLAWARSTGARVGAYLVPSYPTRFQQAVARVGPYGDCHRAVICRLHNDGAAQASEAVATMRRTGVRAPMVGRDVEFRQFRPWSHSRARNAAVIQGAVSALRRMHMPFGVYTTSYMWNDLLGRYRLNVPNWLPVGHRGYRAARRMCTATATGGSTWLVQYTKSLDSDLTCPVLDPVPGIRNRMWPYRRTTLHLLSEGRAVTAVQRYLDVTRSGTFDVGTELAVTTWQTATGLPITGSVTSRDWRAMGAYRHRGGHGFWLRRVAGRP